MSKNDYEDYEESTLDQDEIIGTDVKINPDYYIHTALLKAQKALEEPDIKLGMLRFRIIISHIEGLCRAANMLTNDYKEKIEDFKKSDESYIKASKDVKDVILSNYKLEVLMENVFQNKTSTMKLKG